MIVRTERMMRVLAAIRDLSRDGLAPTYEELRLACGYSSKGTVHAAVAELLRAGLVSHEPRRLRSLRVIGEEVSRAQLEELSDAHLRRVAAWAQAILEQRAGASPP